MEQKTYTVSGMTCAHCVLSVREEVGDVAGVRAVDVELATGRMAVLGDGVDEAAVAAAVAEAGYEVAS